MTHTFAELEVSDKTYDEIKALLKEAGYGHAFVGGAIDMHGIGLIKKPQPKGVDYIRCTDPKHRVWSRDVCLICNPSKVESVEEKPACTCLVDFYNCKVHPGSQPVDRSNVTLTDGSPVTEDHRELKANGQQKGYVVLSEEERAKGFVRPVRCGYMHIGASGPRYPLADLTDEQKERFGDDWAKYEAYPESESPASGRFWTQEELGRIDNGCQMVTTMSNSLAETYARDPKFYSGTFCSGCGKHFPVDEFIWAGTNERVGS
jgi:hypothetical protein